MRMISVNVAIVSTSFLEKFNKLLIQFYTEYRYYDIQRQEAKAGNSAVLQ